MSVPETAVMMQTMAGKDLAALRGMQDSTLFADEIFGFHAQQAIEKSLKAWITIAGGTFGFNHRPQYHHRRTERHQQNQLWKRGRVESGSRLNA